jgi:hypothetical protein
MEIKTKYAEGSPCTILGFNGSSKQLTEEQCKELADSANRAFAIARFMRVVLGKLKGVFSDDPENCDGGGLIPFNEGEIEFSVTVGDGATEDGAEMPIRTYRISAFTVNKMVAFDDGDGLYEFNDREFERYIESEMEGLEA